ncbi:MAG: YraN family protein [Halieaceae bacterium]|jgi:putative endonuclease|nr:YraN family protein [Halieaceae bacterium]
MKSKGDRYEALARQWILGRGMQVLENNYTRKTGEIDIVAIDNGDLVFFEVRARRNTRFASAAESIDRRKQTRILQTAQLFLQSHKQWAHMPCRFDVLTFEPRQSHAESTIRWIRAAFTT